MANLKEMYNDSNLEVTEPTKAPIDDLLIEDYSVKDYKATLRTNKKLYDRFTAVCKKNLLTNSSVLNLLMVEYIEKYEKKMD